MESASVVSTVASVEVGGAMVTTGVGVEPA